MAESFHDLWVAWSDDGGSTWTTQLAFDGLPGHDGSTPFAAFTIDDQGNPYIAFAMNLNAVANGSGVQSLCPAETGATLQADTSCQYNMYVVWGQPDANGDVVFDGGGGLIPNSAAQPYLVNNPTSEPGTHWFPAIAAGDPGQVDVAYLRTPTIEPTDAFGKVVPRACAGAGNGTPPPPPTYPPACQWDLFAGQSLNLTSPPGSATWTTEDLTTPTPMHIGDICNLGIACDPLSNDRNLLDFNSEALDPQGCAHIAYADDNTVNMLRVANQTPGAGCLTLTSATEGAVPEAPWVALFVPAALAATWLGRRSRRRRTRTAI
jgi:hypothetical protein